MEKEKAVVELYKENKTIREIAKEVHMSFGDISTIIKKEFGSNEDKSSEVQAFELFSKGLKPLDVIMKLNMQVDQVKKLYAEYQSLCGLGRINEICKELGEDTEPFFQLYKMMIEQGLDPKEIAEAVRYGNDLPILELKYAKAKDRLEVIRSQKQELVSEIKSLRDDVIYSVKLIANYDQIVEEKTKELRVLDNKQQRFRDGILDLMGSKEYKKVKEIVREQADTILTDKKTLLAVTLFVVLEAMKLDPEKQILLSDVQNFNDNQSYHFELQKKELIELAEQFHDKLANELVNATVNSVFSCTAASTVTS